ncbi:MAG: DegV family protein [candidate division WOR-3 bacterium]
MKIITDESTIIPEEFLNYVKIIPLKLTYGKRDYTGSNHDEILKGIEEGKYFKTGLPSPGEILQFYKKYKDEKIISVHVSSKISGVINSASIAAKEAKKEGIDVYLVDSKSAGPGCGMGIIKGIKYYEEKKKEDIKEIIKIIEETAKKSYALMAVPESHRLIKVRPIEGLKKFFKNPDYFIKFLRSKGGFPIISLAEEKLKILEFATEKGKAIEYMINFLKEKVKKESISVLYFYSTEKMFIYDLEEKIDKEFDVKNKWIARVSPVILSAIGRYAFGFCFYIDG